MQVSLAELLAAIPWSLLSPMEGELRDLAISVLLQLLGDENVRVRVVVARVLPT